MLALEVPAGQKYPAGQPALDIDTPGCKCKNQSNLKAYCRRRNKSQQDTLTNQHVELASIG